MIKLLGKLPRQLYVACSGGVDSMAALDFLSRNHEVTVAFFDHGTTASLEALRFLRRYCDHKGLDLVDGAVMRARRKDESLEEYWRDERYRYFDHLGGTVVTAHHLDDAVETWIWSSLHGQPKLPQYSRGKVLRPFMLNTKQDLMDWATFKSVPFYTDESNYDTRFTRNYIRHEMMDHVLRVNPGIQKTIKKKLTAGHTVL